VTRGCDPGSDCRRHDHFPPRIIDRVGEHKCRSRAVAGLDVEQSSDWLYRETLLTTSRVPRRSRPRDCCGLI
jgi:hypothetical protein